MKPLLYVACMAIVLPCIALARPVSYPSCTTIMQMSDVDAHSIHIHYSPTAKYSVGYKSEYWRDEE